MIAEYPYSYYAYRAREIMGKSAPIGAELGPTNSFPDTDAELARINDPRLDAVRELLAVDLRRDATREMKTLAAAYPDNAGIDLMLADVYAGGGEAFEAIGHPAAAIQAVHPPRRLADSATPLGDPLPAQLLGNDPGGSAKTEHRPVPRRLDHPPGERLRAEHRLERRGRRADADHARRGLADRD